MIEKFTSSVLVKTVAELKPSLSRHSAWFAAPLHVSISNVPASNYHWDRRGALLVLKWRLKSETSFRHLPRNVRRIRHPGIISLHVFPTGQQCFLLLKDGFVDIPFISIFQESGMLSGGRGRGRKKIEMGAASRGSLCRTEGGNSAKWMWCITSYKNVHLFSVLQKGWQSYVFAGR